MCYAGCICKVLVINDCDCIPVLWKTVSFSVLTLPELFKVIHVDSSVYVVALNVRSQINKLIFACEVHVFCKVVSEYITGSSTNHFCLKSSPVIIPTKLNNRNFNSRMFFRKFICCCLISRELGRIPKLVADCYFLAAFFAARNKTECHETR